MRGYCCIGLTNPKTPENVGSAMRACGVYGANSVFYTGKRFSGKGGSKFCTDPMKSFKHSPLIPVNDLKSVIPFDCVPVAIDLIDGAESIINYRHPERAFYIFGPEDGTLGKSTTGWCKDVVYIPTNGCMNLAATVNVVLYDRMAKESMR